MSRILWAAAVLHIFQLLQVNAITKRNSDENDLSDAMSEEKLPDNVLPSGYILDVCPMPDDAYFKGRVTINLTWLEETDKITLHADPDLVIYQTELVVMENDAPSTTIRILRSDRDPSRSWYIIHLIRSLSAGTLGQLFMSFTGKLDMETHQGLFISTYEDSSTDETKYFIGSNFKPNFARKVFPCFDMPEYKVPFAVSIVRRNSMTALSNMPLEKSETLSMDPTWTRDYFQESFPMTTYSLGILVSDFNSLSIEEEFEGERNFDAQIRIWGKPDILDTAQNFSQRILKTLNSVGDIMGLPFPLPKLDYVFLPEVDSNNWGLILQSEFNAPQTMLNVICQWIGNLITPTEWIDEFIGEGLGVFLTAYIALQDTDHQDMITERILQVIYSIMDEDGELKEIKDVSDVKNVKATKVAMIFRMLNYTLGEANLKQGLQRLVSETQYKTYTANDIWNAITEQAHTVGALDKDISINEIANSWISEDHIPILTVERNYTDNSATFFQHTYKRTKPINEANESDGKWVIPVVLVKENNLDFTNMPVITWLKEKFVSLPKIENRNSFIIVNPEEIGAFPVNYDEENWKLISDFLQNPENIEKIPPITRAKLLHDAFILAYAGELSYKTALDMVIFLNNEDKDVVWERFFMAADFIEKYISESQTVYEKFLRFLRQWLLSLYGRLDENEDQEPSSLKIVTRKTLCEIGYKPCVEDATSNFHQWLEADDADCDTDILANACYVFRWESFEEFEVGLDLIMDKESNSSSDHLIFNTLVRCADSSWKIERLLNISIFERAEDFSDDDIESIILQLSTNAVGYGTLLLYMDQNWHTLKERFEDKEELWKNLIKTASSHFKTQENLDLLKIFYSTRSEEFGSAKSTIEAAVNDAERNVQHAVVNYQVIEEWLDNYLNTHEDNTGDNFLSYEH